MAYNLEASQDAIDFHWFSLFTFLSEKGNLAEIIIGYSQTIYGII